MSRDLLVTLAILAVAIGWAGWRLWNLWRRGSRATGCANGCAGAACSQAPLTDLTTAGKTPPGRPTPCDKQPPGQS